MNRFIFWSLYAFVIQLYLNVPVYFGATGGNIVLPFMNYIFMGTVFVYVLLNLQKIRLPFSFIGWYVILFLFALLSCAILGAWMIGDDLVNYAKSFVLMICCILFFGISFANHYKVMSIFVIAAILAVFFNIIDFFFQGQFFQILDGLGVRAAGFYVNPNNSAAAILLAMGLSTQSLPSRFRIWFVFICLIGVALTLSRGGIIVWLILYASLLARKTIDIRRGLISVVVLILLIGTTGGLIGYLSGVVDLSSYSDRLSFFQGQQVGQSVTTDSRYDLLLLSAQLFEQSPLWGNGMYALLRHGSEQLSHNEYLAMLADYGVFGLLVYLVMIYSVFKKKPEFFTACVCILCWGVFAHDILIQYAFVIVFACVAQYRSHYKPLLSI